MSVKGEVNCIGSHKYIYNVYFLFSKNHDFDKIKYHIGMKTNWDLYFSSNNRQYDVPPPTNINLSMPL
jgi:hypothetical protein